MTVSRLVCALCSVAVCGHSTVFTVTHHCVTRTRHAARSRLHGSVRAATGTWAKLSPSSATSAPCARRRHSPLAHTAARGSPSVSETAVRNCPVLAQNRLSYRPPQLQAEPRTHSSHHRICVIGATAKSSGTLLPISQGILSYSCRGCPRQAWKLSSATETPSP